MSMERLDKDKILDSLTEDDIVKLVTELGSLPPKKGTHGELICQTICHNKPSSDNSWKLYWYPADAEHKRGLFHCYTGCADSFNAIELVIRAKRTQGNTYTFYKALRYLASVTGKLSMTSTDVVEDERHIEDFSWINKIKAAKKGNRNAPQLKTINENILETFCYEPIEEWLNEGISREALSAFEISYYGLTNQIVIPHRDLNGNLVGIRGRYLDQEDIDRIGKYVPLQIGSEFLSHSLGSNLYGLNVSKNAIMRKHKILITESEKSCLQAYTMYGDESFVAAVCGSNISQTQRKIILQTLGCSKIYWMPDREYHKADSFEAEAYLNKLLIKIGRLNLQNYAETYLLLDDTDEIRYKQNAFDTDKECVERLIDNRILVTNEMIQEAMDKRNKN